MKGAFLSSMKRGSSRGGGGATCKEFPSRQDRLDFLEEATDR